METTELVAGLKALLAAEGCDEAVRLVAAAIKGEGVDAEISTDDGAADDLSSDDALWVTSDHALVIDGETVVEWRRCSRGTWGEAGRQCSEDEWCVSEDTDGGDELPDSVAVALDALGLTDEIPDVPAPELATDAHEPDPAGEFGVYWETVGDDARAVARYATLDAARAVCDQKNREFAANNPSSGTTTYLCGFGVRKLIDGEWRQCDDDGE